MENTDKQWIDELHRRLATAKQKAYDDEIKRIEKDIALQAHSLIQKYFTEQDSSLKETLQKAAEERDTAVEKLQQRKGEILRLLAVERKKKEDARRKTEEERKKQEELERKRIAEEEKKRREREEQEQKEKIHAAIDKIRALYTGNELEDALLEVGHALELDPNNEDLKIWEHRLEEARQKKAREEETALNREKEAAQQERKRKAKVVRLASIAVVAVALILLVYQFQKNIFPRSVYLAVEPFTIASSNSVEPTLGAALGREIAGKLSLFPNVRVMGYSSSWNVASNRGNVERIMNKLGYAFVLKGTLSMKGDIYVADVKVIDSTSNEVWSGHFEQPSATFMQLPEEITIQLGKVMDVDLNQEAVKNIRRSGTGNVLAYLHYLNGNEFLDERTMNGAQRALTKFNEAINSDSRFAESYAGVASVLLMKIEKRWDHNDSTIELVQRLVQQALKFQPMLISGKLAQARLWIIQRKYNDAQKILDEALQKYPYNSDVLYYKAILLAKIGNYDEALSTLIKGYEINPRDVDILHLLGDVNSLKGKQRDAMQMHEYALPYVEDSTRYLADVVNDVVLSDPDLQVLSGKRIVAACERLLAENPRDLKLLYQYAQILQVLGKIPEANHPLLTMRSILQNKLIYSPRDAEAMMDLALALTRYGAFPEGLDMARRALSVGKANVTILYKVSQMYSVQMASHKGGKIDTLKKAEALKFLRQAVGIDFRLENVLDGDFYNLRTQAEFLQAIQLQSK